MTSAELTQRAQAGDVAAMQQLLEQALVHKQIQVEVQLEDACVYLTLTAESVPPQQMATILVGREIQTWHLQNIETVNLAGQEQGTIAPAWVQAIALTPLSPATMTLDEAVQSKRLPIPADRINQPQRSMNQRPEARTALGIDQEGWKSLIAGLVLALLILASGQVTFLLSPLITLVHELGHTCAAWLFGYPAIPAFDFLYGGGVTFHATERWSLILVAIYSGFGYLFYRYWHDHPTARGLLATVTGYTILAFTPGHQILMVWMGHGFELLFAGIFLYRALSGSGCRYNIERPLYGMVSFFTLFYDLRFAHGLMFNPTFRQIYEQGKGGVIDHDFVRLANTYLGVDLAIVVSFFMICCLATPMLVFLWFRYSPFKLST